MEIVKAKQVANLHGRSISVAAAVRSSFVRNTLLVVPSSSDLRLSGQLSAESVSRAILFDVRSKTSPELYSDRNTFSSRAEADPSEEAGGLQRRFRRRNPV